MGGMVRATATFPKDRMSEGVIEFFRDEKLLGSFRCLARSDSSAASAHGNPTRDPMRPFGDLPAGIYRAIKTIPAADRAAERRSYGTQPRFVLTPLSGPALLSVQRWGLLIHGGDLGRGGALRPSHGCLRWDDSTAAQVCLWLGEEETFELLAIELVPENRHGVLMHSGRF